MLVGFTLCGNGAVYCTGPGIVSLLAPTCHSESKSNAIVAQPATALSNPAVARIELLESFASRNTYPKLRCGASVPNLAETMPSPRPENLPDPSRLSALPVGKRPSKRMAAPNELLCVTLIFSRAATSPRPLAEPSMWATAVSTGFESVPAKRCGDGNSAGMIVATLVPCTDVCTTGTATERSTPSTKIGRAHV